MDYLGYFKLREPPFTLTPDPSFLFQTHAHKRALEGLAAFVEQGEGYAVLSGDIGTGKTTICRALLERLGGRAEAALVVNPFLDEVELLRAIALDFGALLPDKHRGEYGVQAVLEAVRDFLLEAHKQGKRSIVIVDEAHNLPVAALEQLRIVGNLETNKEKLLQVLFVGQPELTDRLASPRVRQLQQRIARWFTLEPLARDDIEPYFHYRLEHAGMAQKLRLDADASALAYKLTGGYPRMLNMLFARTLHLVADRGKWGVQAADVREAASELPARRPGAPAKKPAQPRAGRGALVAVAAVLLVAGVAGGFALSRFVANRNGGEEPAPPTRVQQPAVPQPPDAPPASRQKWTLSLGVFATEREGTAALQSATPTPGVRRFLLEKEDGKYFACVGIFTDRAELDSTREKLLADGVEAKVEDISQLELE